MEDGLYQGATLDAAEKVGLKEKCVPSAAKAACVGTGLWMG
jgi:hypothetical protein